ncbi:MAG: DEAD/DEAH box helicase [Oscillospiraceae bacterium]|nr:DEAD/DEAH box helicase [Oscillospiraceae bacterium]
MSDNVFYRLAPFIQDYIYRNKWEELRDIQVAAAEVIFDTEDNLLLTSGTASGKTEAAFLPILTQLWENPSGSVGALYISPLKALINDQFERLEELLEEADIPVTKWHGDASPAKKKRLLQNPRGVMQTTPESLESLLIRNSSGVYKLFSDLRFIVIDEVHYFMDNDRGLQLLSVLERLQRIIGFVPRRVGLSATLNGDAPQRWLSMGTNVPCITPKTEEKGRTVRLSVRFFPIAEKIPQKDSKALLENYYEYLYESTHGKRCILFSNSKGEVEENIAHLKRLSEKHRGNDCYLVHHANISPALREFAEQRMKSGELPVCTGATVTLELGIDLGHLERIVQTGCPLTVSGLVQRLGRTGRRKNDIGEMRFAFRWDMSLPPNDFYKEINWDLVMCTAMILLYTREKWVEPMYLPKLPYSLLYHQTMSVMAASGSVTPQDLARQILTLSVFGDISKEDYQLLLRHLLENGQLERGEDGLMVGEKGEGTVNNYDFLAVFSVPVEYVVRCNTQSGASAEIIGTVQNPFPPRSQFALAGQAWEVTELDKKSLTIYVKKIEGISANMWTDTGNEYVHTRVMKKMLEVLRSDEEYAFLDDSAKRRLAYIRTLCRNAAMGAEIQSEHIILPLSRNAFAVFPFLGTRGTMALMYALRERGFSADVWLQRYIPVCIEVKTDLGMETLISALDEIKQKGADKYSFRIPDNCEIVGKFNDYIPRQLLKKQYIEDYLDTEELSLME